MDSLEQLQAGLESLSMEAPPKRDTSTLADAHKTYNGLKVESNPPPASVTGKERQSLSHDPVATQRSVREMDAPLPHPKIQDNPLELPEKTISQSPALPARPTSTSDQPHTTPISITDPITDAKTHQALKVELKQLAGVPGSHYPRLYPSKLYGARRRPNVQLLDEFSRKVKEILHRNQLLEDPTFKCYLESKSLELKMFDPNCFMWKAPNNLLEIVTHFLFPNDPVLKHISFSQEFVYFCSYADDEIMEVNEPITVELIEGIEVKYTHNNRPIIQQQAARIDASAVTAMLLLQHERPFSFNELKSRQSDGDDCITGYLSAVGLSPLIVGIKTLKDLAHAIHNNGAAIVMVNQGMQQHRVIVDEVTDGFVLIRDPYHGWEARIYPDAFLKTWSKECQLNVIQVKNQ